MKLVQGYDKSQIAPVAPRAGAWIETPYVLKSPLIHQWSPPARGRGLKRVNLNIVWGVSSVAPRAGAWIETVTI